MDVQCSVLAVCAFLLSNSAEGRLYNLHTTDITTSSARLRWRWTAGDEEVLDYKVQCFGVNHYISALGEHRTAVHKRVQYAPAGLRGLNYFLLGGLLPRFVYTCNVTEQPNPKEMLSRISKFGKFVTDSSAPEAPSTPVIHIGSDEDNTNITVQLFRTSTKNGPISGYKVQFHVIDPESPYFIAKWLSINEELLDPFGQLNTKEMAQKKSYAISFRMSFSNSSFPSTISVGDDLLKGALKSGVRYCVLTVAFTVMEKRRLKEKRVVLFTPSMPSKTFVPYQKGFISKKLLSRAQKTLLVVVGMVLPVALSLYVIMFAALVLYTKCLQPPRKREWTVSYGSTTPRCGTTVVLLPGEECDSECAPLLIDSVPLEHFPPEPSSAGSQASRVLVENTESIHVPIGTTDSKRVHVPPSDSQSLAVDSMHIDMIASLSEQSVIVTDAENASSASSASIIVNIFDCNGNFKQSFNY